MGAGFIGRAVAHQLLNVLPGMTLAALGNRSLEGAQRAMREADCPDFRIVRTVGELEDRLERPGEK